MKTEHHLKFNQIIIKSIILSSLIYIVIPLLDYTKKGPEQISTKKINTIEIIPHQKPLKIKKPTTTKTIKNAPIQKKQQPLYKALPIDHRLNLTNHNYPVDFSHQFAIASPIALKNDIFTIDEIDKKPAPLFQIDPTYPVIAKENGIEGIVNLSFIVEKNGIVNKIQVLSSENGKYFIEPAIEAVKKWTFLSGEKDGKAVAVKVTIPLKFMLN